MRVGKREMPSNRVLTSMTASHHEVNTHHGMCTDIIRCSDMLCADTVSQSALEKRSQRS